MAQQLGHDQAADKAADRRPGEGHHNHRCTQTLRCVVAGQRCSSGKRAGDTEPGEETQRAQHAERPRERARQRGQAEDCDAGEQERLAPKAVTDRPRGEGADQDAEIGPQEGQRKGRRRQVPSMGQGRHSPADRTDIVPVAHLDQGAERRDADLQTADLLVLERRLRCR